MYRVFLSAASLLSLFSLCALPMHVNAQGVGICPQANVQCAKYTATGPTLACFCNIPPGYVVLGKCTAPEVCTGTSWGVGTAANLGEATGLASNFTALPPTLESALNPSILDQAMGFMSKNPLISGLAMGAGMSLLSSLMSPSGSSNNSGSTGANSTYCSTGAYYYSANPPPGDPCAVYSPTGGGSTLPTQGAQDTSISSLLNGLTNPTVPTINITVPSTTQPSVSDLLNTSCPTIAVLIACPDGQVLKDQGKDSKGCDLGPACVAGPATGATTTPTNPILPTGPACGGGFCGQGMFCSTIMPGQCVPDGRVDCGSFSCDLGTTCGSGGQCISNEATTTVNTGTTTDVNNIISDPNLYNNNTSSTTPAPSQTPLNQKKIPVPEGGIHGDLLSFGGGATIFARNRSDTSEVSGFFGGSGAGSLCQRRPWATNFLSYIIPPAFFDGLCSAAGFGGSGSGAPGGSGGVGTAHAISGPATPSYTPPPPQTGVHPEAKIRASPPNVNVGGRTTVFWTSQDVSSCQESSSDGNFTGNSVSGGASTVSLSGPVVFYIRCLGVDGNYITDSTTVNIGI